MSFERKAPTIKVELDIELYNRLVSLLSIASKQEDEYTSNQGIGLKDKITTYAVPKKDSENNEYVDIRFFASEVNILVGMLLSGLGKLSDEDYYQKLLDKRAEYMENR